MGKEQDGKGPEILHEADQNREYCYYAIQALRKNRNTVFLAGRLVGVLRFIEEQTGLDPLEDDSLKTTNQVLRETQNEIARLKAEGADGEEDSTWKERVKIFRFLGGRVMQTHDWLGSCDYYSEGIGADLNRLKAEYWKKDEGVIKRWLGYVEQDLAKITSTR